MSIEAMKLALDALTQDKTNIMRFPVVYQAAIALGKAIVEVERQSAFTNGAAGTEKCAPGGGGYPVASGRLIVEGDK